MISPIIYCDFLTALFSATYNGKVTHRKHKKMMNGYVDLGE